MLYRAVRRLAGPLAGIVAAVVLAASPVTVALNRGNVADSLLIMLIVLAADATTSALLSGRLRTLLIAGVWVGLAFQAKMLAAWLVLPALAGAYLLAAPASLRTRAAHVALAGLTTAAVSLSWMTLVTLVPTHDRPYVDGTQNNSLFSQTFDYNGFARLGSGNVFAGAGHPAAFLVKLSEVNAAPAHRVQPSWHRLLGGLFGRDDGWLLVAATIAAAAVLLARRGTGRRDPLRTLVILWGAWLLILGAFFSASSHPNSYYVAALSPATGALCGAGATLAQRAGGRAARIWLALALLCSVGYGAYLLGGGVEVPAWLIPVASATGVAGAGLLLLVRKQGGVLQSPTGSVVVTLACALVLPGVASALIVTRARGPFAAPFQSASATPSPSSERHSRETSANAIEALSAEYGAPIPLATDSSILAASFIVATGKEILPIGGYQGGVPAPSLADLRRRIAAGQVRIFLVPLLSDDPRIAWITTHCKPLGPLPAHRTATSTALLDCGAA